MIKMVKFVYQKIVRDKTVERHNAAGIKTQYKMLGGKELCQALLLKLLEESNEVCVANNREELVSELADVLEVIDGLCKANSINLEEVMQRKQQKHNERGGFETGLYVERIETDEDSPTAKHLRASPDKYPEIK